VETLLLSLLISFILITVAGHVHFKPMGMSLSVSAQFVYTNPFLTFILGVVLDIAVEAVLSVPVRVVARAGLNSFIAKLHSV
jgi:hypothetical protein